MSWTLTRRGRVGSHVAPETRSPVRPRGFRHFRVGIALAILFCYVGSYYAITSYTRRQCAPWIEGGVYFVPCSIERLAEDKDMQDLNYYCFIFYAPIYAFDHYVAGGPAYIQMAVHVGPMWNSGDCSGPAELGSPSVRGEE